MPILETLAATIDESGISTPTYPEILESLQDSYRQIYGSDVYLAADSQDGQWLAILAKAIYDTNNMAISVFNGFAPGYAVGAHLSALVKINGLKRKTASYSSAVVTLVGVVGTVITNGAINDTAGQRWLLPAVVEIPLSGQIDVTATALVEGAVSAAAGTINRIATPVPGWQSVTNELPATLGDPVEGDAKLRQRQAQSTAIAAQSSAGAILAAILNLPGVSRARIYENSADGPDGNGIPAHSIAAVVEGGQVSEIARAIAYTKSPGTGTYGTTTALVVDPAGVPITTNYFALSERTVTFRITIRPLTGYLNTVGEMILRVVAAYINALDIGETVYHNRLWAAANLQGEAATASEGLTQIELDRISDTFNVLSITLSLDGINFAADDLYIAFNEAAVTTVSRGTLSLYPSA